MADKTVIVEINYDTDAAIKNVNQLTQAIEGERVAQARLKSELEAGTISQNEYSKQVEESKTTMSKANSERKNYINQLAQEKGSINEIKAQIKTLTAERDKLNQSTKEGQEASQKFNSQIEVLKDALKGAQTETGKSVGVFGKLKENLSSIPGPVGGVVSGIGGMTKAALAFIATPIGAVLAAIVAVLGLLKKAFMGTEENQNKVNKATAVLSGLFQALLAALRPIAEFIFDKIGKAFEFLGKVADTAINLVSKGLKVLGFEGAANAIDNFNNKVKESARLARELADAEAKLTEAQRWARKTQLDYQKEAEKLRQLRDDESNSIAQRIKYNEQLGAVLKNQLGAEMAIAQQALKVAELRIKQEGASTENLNARAEAMTEIADIQERITGQESEQLANLNSLRKEAADKEKALAEQKKKDGQMLLDIQKENAAAAKKVEQDAYDFEQDLLAQSREAANKDQEEYDKREQERLQIRGQAIVELAKLKEQELINEAKTADDKKKAEIAQADKERQRAIDASQGTNEELEVIEQEHKMRLLEIETAYQETIKEQRRAVLEEQLNQLQQIIDASQGMADQRVTIATEAFAKLSTINWAEVKSSKDAFIAIGNAAKGLTSLITTGYDKEAKSLADSKAKELALAGENAEAKAAIEAVYAKKEEDLKRQQAKKDKAKAIVDATIATALAVVNSLRMGLPQGLVFAALAAVAGGIQIATIANQPLSYAKGGMIGGKPHSQGGTKFYGDDGSMFEAERGESMFVLKKDATAEIAALGMINESFGGRSWTSAPAPKLADGGEVASVQPVDIEKQIDAAFQRTPIYVKVGDIETGMTESRNVKQAGVI